MRLTPLLLIASVVFVLGADSPHIKAASEAYETGKAAAQAKRFPEAIAQFRLALEIEPTFRDSFDALIQTLLASGERSEAVPVTIRLLEIEPDLVRYRVLLGQLLLEEGEPKRALAQFSLALARNDFDADALLGFAEAAKRLGMNTRAGEAIERGRKQYPMDKRFGK